MLSIIHRTAWTVLVAGILAGLGALRADAQLDVIPKVRVKAGIFLPQNSSLKDAVGDVWLKVGADVSLPFTLLPLGSTRVGIEYGVKESSTFVPITITQIWQPSAVVARSPVYFGAGVGLWTARVKGTGTASRFGLRFLAGVDFTDRLFLEAEYDLVDSFSGTRVSGLSVLVGTKF